MLFSFLTCIPRLIFWLIVKIISAINHRRTDKSNHFLQEKNVLINISSGVGDAIMAIPLLKAIHAHFPDASISIIANRSTQPLFQTFLFIAKIYCADEYRTALKYIRLVNILRKDKYHRYIGAIPSNTIRMMLIPFLVSIPFRIKHSSPHSGANNYDFLFHHLEPIPENRHRIDCNLDLLKTLAVEDNSIVEFPLLPLPENTKSLVKNQLTGIGLNPDLPLIAVHPGCNPKAYYKRWPPENYVKLLNQFQRIHNMQILLVGGRDELAELQEIENSLAIQPLNVAGKMNLLETACALSLCKFLISNDSGIMHLATAVDIPVFAIFGPTNENHIGPYGKKHTVIRNGKTVEQVSVDQALKILLESTVDLFHIA